MTLLDVLEEIEREGAKAEYQREQSIDTREHNYWDGRIAQCRDLRQFVEIAARKVDRRKGDRWTMSSKR